MDGNIKHILILGGTGFIGKAFLKELVLEKNVFFHILIHKTSQEVEIDNAKFYYGNLLTFNWNKLNNFPDIIYHFGRLNSKRGKILGRKLAAIKGFYANKRFLRYLQNEKKKTKLIYLSGSLMYGNNEKEITENSKLNPTSFAKEYIYAEKPFLNCQNNNSLLKITFVRVPWVLGGGSWFKSFYKNYIIKHNEIPIYGKGNNVMSFITLTDLSKCLVLLLKYEYKKTIHITYNNSISQIEFVSLISELLKLKMKNIKLEQFESAIIEAFESNINLISMFNIFECILENKNLNLKIREELTLIFKNI